jgi:hypothetical protein
MADDIRQRIIASVFSKRSPSGALEEQYISHIKIYEDVAPGQDDGGRKARYILLSREYSSNKYASRLVDCSISLPQRTGLDPQVTREYQRLIFDWQNMGPKGIDSFGSLWS